MADLPDHARQARRARRRRALAAVLALAALELGVRAHRGTLGYLGNPRRETPDMLRSQYPAVYDAQLGYVPRTGYRARNLMWRVPVTIDALGLRAHAAHGAEAERPILAVGDSFTFGDAVGDDDTWPAQLERRLGRRVLNGGVFGYGADQIVLRAESLALEHDAEMLIVSLIGDDIARSEFSYRFAWKPYFVIENAELQLKGVPVPRSPNRPRFQWLRATLGYSAAADAVLARLAGQWWLLEGDVTRVHARGAEVACRLLDRLARLSQPRPLKTLVVVQWGGPLFESEPAAGVDRLIEHAQDLGLPALDLRAATLSAWRLRRSLFAGGHMSAEGNTWVAERVGGKLVGLGWVSAP